MYQSEIHISYISQTILYLIIYFFASDMFHPKLFPRHLCLCAFTFWIFIYLSFSDNYTCVFNGFRTSAPTAPSHACSFPSWKSTYPSFTPALLWGPPNFRRIAWERKSCVLFPCMGTGKCKWFYGKRKVCMIFFRWTHLAISFVSFCWK